MAGEARREDQVFDLVMGTDDAVVIEGVDLVVARPRPFEPQLFEGRDPARERRPDRFLEQFMLGLVVALGVRIAVRGRRDAAYETGRPPAESRRLSCRIASGTRNPIAAP